MTSRPRRIACCVAAVIALGPAVLLAQAGSSTVRSPMDATMLAVGDIVRITVWRKPELSGEFVVTSDGRLAHPLYRDVQVGGLSVTAAEGRLKTLLEKYEANPQFVVEPLLRVAVGGEVRQPNLYNLQPETSLSQAVALAGGPTERGRHDRLRLIRDNRESIIDLKRVDASGAGMRIQSGDQIVVEQDRAVFRDWVAPIIGVMGGIASIVSVILYNGN